ncbi:E3 ubiquitin-protein ligase FANCL-like [Penaeus monodon]|uniref:E3 ubiquitin-protein ligase FANCL-like n=1 Tax=Penaeus monodon TaxID=6687 RepID=UPI0018A78344|nr:E3 ubiquitin-protein ligase FANCL-like [Penaeus monodon]XP_037804328.1 E3 ubiquitin-protein ligase FANCL-like [Penaeus monodon]
MAGASLGMEFPLLLPTFGSQSTSFHGFLTVGRYDYEVHLEVPHFPDVKGMTLSTDAWLASIIKRCQEQLSQEEKDCHTVQEYLRKFQEICAAVTENEDSVSLPQDAMFTTLLSHIEAIGWSKVSQVSTDFSMIYLETKDERERLHSLRVKIQSGYPSVEPVVEADLPVDIDITWNTSEGLSCIMSAWEEKLSTLQELWDALDELDETALVLDPPNPTRKHTSRRILLSNHVSVQLTVSIAHPRSLPQCHLLGSSHLTAPLNARLTNNYDEWDPERSIVSNLEIVLGVDVVKSMSRESGEDAGGSDWSAECAVCYCLHLEGALPDLTCDHCSQAFHVQCLYEWLCSVPNSRQSMNFIFGECPYCTQLISCKVPTG